MSVVWTWMTKNKSDRLHNKGCHLKGQCNMTFFCTKGLSMQTNKCMATSASLCEGPIFYFYAKSQKFSFYSFLFFSFGKHHVVRKDLGTYVQLNIDSMSYYCWHHPWGENVGRRNYKPISFYVSDWNVLLMGTRWVLAIIEDYMMVEYVDLPKGSDTWPFLKRWWIVVAKLTENIVCLFLIEFLPYTSIVWWTITYSWEVYDEGFMIKVLCLVLLLL